MGRNEIALKILCAFLSAENYRGQLDRATPIAGAYAWADEFIAKSLEAVPDTIRVKFIPGQIQGS